MTFLPVVVREMFVAARHRRTYSARVGISAVALLLMGWLLLIASAQIPAAEQGRLLFTAFSAIAFTFCLLAGSAVTADCLSEEKREGTLGLLFLTDLKGYDVALGKLTASALKTSYGLMAIIPMMSLAVLLGGVTAGEVGRVAGVLMNTLFFSLAAGVFVSTISRNERKAMFATALLILAVALGPFGLALGLDLAAIRPAGEQRWLLVISPISAFLMANPARFGWLREFWCSLLCTHLTGWILLALSGAVLPKVCRDRPRTGSKLRWWELWQRWSYGRAVERSVWRARLLDQNPFLWLAGRDRLRLKLVWVFLFSLAFIWMVALLSSSDLAVSAGAFVLFCAHSVLKIWLVSEVCSRSIEDRRSGALELLLSTPLSVGEIARGQKLALRSQFGKAVGVILAIDLVLLICVLFHLGDPEALRLAAVVPAGMIMLVADLTALRWLSMWLALTAKGMGQALLGAWLRVLALPWFAFLTLYWTVTLYSQFLGRRELSVSAQNWTVLWVMIGLGVDWLFGTRAKRRFMNEFRTIASERFAPRSRHSLTQAAFRLFREAMAGLMNRSPSGESTNWTAVFRRRTWLWPGVAGALLAVGWFGWYRVSISKEIRDELAAVRKAGYPTTEAELAKWHPPIPINENLANVIAQATPRMYSVQWLPKAAQTNLQDLMRRDFFTPREPWPEDLKQAMSAFVSSNDPALKLLHEIVDYRKSRYNSFWESSLGNWWGPVVRYSEVIQLLKTEAMLRVEEGKPDQAVHSLSVLLAFARSLADEPLLHLRSWQNASLRAIASELQHLLTRDSLTDAQLRELESRVGEIEGGERLARALAGDRLVRGRFFELTAPQLLAVWGGSGAARWQTVGFGLLQGVRVATGLRDRDYLLYLRTMKSHIEVARLPYPENLRRAGQVANASGSSRALPLDLTSQLVPNLRSLLNLEAEKDARLRMMQTSIAVERYRLKNNGRLPESLGQLVPAYLKRIPADPFDGKPLRYKRLETGYVTYSVGADQNDDGGRELLKSGKGPRDLTFTVGR